MKNRYRGPDEEFVSEAIALIPGALFMRDAEAGEPALPSRFRWRGTEYEVSELLKSWRSTGPDRGGSQERYLRKHWYRVLTADGLRMTLYFERQPRSKNAPRWWLATIDRTRRAG
jgi:hypothetical protein